MDRSHHQYAAAPRAVLDFLKKTLPFNELEDAVLLKLAELCLLDFYPRGTVILRQDVGEATHVHLILTGGVKVYWSGDKKVVTLKEYGGRGESFGTSAIIRSSRAEFTVEAVEDTFCLLIGAEAFLEILHTYPRFARYFDDSSPEAIMRDAYSEQRLEKVSARTEETFHLFNARVADLIRQTPEVVDASAAVREVGALMAERGVPYVLVREPSGKVIGTVTNHDLRTKVVAKGLDYGTSVERIMTSPVRTVPAPALIFEAVLTMMEQKVDHLAVLDHDEVVGIINAPDLMVHIGSSPLYLFREIASKRTVEELHDLGQKVPVLVRSLLEEGAKAGDISEMITVFSDNILNRILTLIQDDLGPPPEVFDWLGLGSEGRREQTFRTDQDNGLVYAEPEDPEGASRAEEYFRAFAHRAVDSLEKSGYPRCRNHFMASNPRWRGPWSTWRDCFDEWIVTPMPPDIYLSPIFFDFRSVAGNGTLAQMLRTRVEMKANRHPRFLQYFVRYFLLNQPPLSFYANTVVEHDGSQSKELDLKTRTVTPFVDFARIMSLLHGIRETNTLSRLSGLADQGRLPAGLHADACRAFEYDLHLTLVHQLRMVETGREPNNLVQPADLSDLERRTLKSSFSVIDRLIDYLRNEFKLSPLDRAPVAGRARARGTG
jgi:CBS domain-containing protein